MYFSAFPLLRLTICFALGIVGFHYLGTFVLIPWEFLFAGIILYFFLSSKSSFRYQVVLAFLAFFLLFGLGTQRLEGYKDEARLDHLLNQSGVIEAYKALVVESPEAKEKSIGCRLEVYEVLIDGNWELSDGVISAYLDLENGKSVKYGDLLYVTGKPETTSPPANPDEFDYRRYLTYNRIYHQQFIGDQFTVIGHEPMNWFVKKANYLRSESIEIISALITDDRARGITLALVLGVKDDLQDDVIQAFSATGAMHVLAVSGLHVGIIYALVFLVLKRIGLSKRKYRWWLAILSMLMLWSYALLTGLSPSVLRAVTMFSFIAIGRALSRNTNIYNTLAASALALLLYNPYLIMSVGFQLSYLAVFGIVYIQPKLYALFQFDHWLIDKIWAITCVSIAAQLATAPLSVLYFHQFPTYFLLSNLFIIPAGFVILASGLLLLSTSAVSVVAGTLGWLVTKFIVAVNGLVFWISELPGSTLDGIYLSILDTWIIYGLMCCAIVFLVKRRFVFIKYALVFSVVLAVSQVWHFSQFAQTNEFSVMDVSGSNVLDFRSGFESYLLADSSYRADGKGQRFHLYPKRLRSGSKQQPIYDKLKVVEAFTPLGTLITFKGAKILYLDQKVLSRLKSSASIDVDWLILGKNALNDLSQLEGKISFNQLIIDPTNSWYIDRSLVSQSDSLNINYHSIRQDGYFSKRWKRSNL